MWFKMKLVLSLLTALAPAYAIPEEEGFHNYLRPAVHAKRVHEMMISDTQQLLQYDYHPDMESGRGARDLGFASSSMNQRGLEYEEGESAAPVWFMSYPETGVVLFMSLLMQSTEKNTATNYGTVFLDYEKRALVGNGPSPERLFPGGPALYDPNLAVPDKFIAVRTHGEGFCYWCHPEHYNEITSDLFFNKAAEGYVKSNGSVVDMGYDPTIVKRMIHLIRDPFDTVVTRYYTYLNIVKSGKLSKLKGSNFKPNQQGFKEWCARMNKTFEDDEMPILANDGNRIRGKDVPCRQEFLKIIKFNNNIIRIASQHNIVRLPIKYENYVQDTIDTVEKVNDFLKLETVNKDFDVSFGNGNGRWMFKSFFTDYERKRIMDFLRFEASAELWQHIKMYSPEYDVF